MSPEVGVFEVVKAPQYKRFPLVDASHISKCVIVPHDPVAVGKVTAESFAVAPLDAAEKLAAVRA